MEGEGKGKGREKENEREENGKGKGHQVEKWEGNQVSGNFIHPCLFMYKIWRENRAHL